MKNNSSSSSSRSEAQAAASRANGARSKGPVTPEGKARSSQNNLKHGLRSSRVVLANESLEDYNALLDSYLAEWRPVGQTETDLLVQMVNALWQLRRIESLETATLDTEMFLQKPDFDHTFTHFHPAMRQADGALAIAAQNFAMLEFLHKAHARLSRTYERTAKHLFQLQTSRLGHPPQRIPPSQPSPESSPDSQNATAEPGSAVLLTGPNYREPESFAWLSTFIPSARRPSKEHKSWADNPNPADLHPAA